MSRVKELINRYKEIAKQYDIESYQKKEDYHRGVAHGQCVAFLQAKNLLKQAYEQDKQEVVNMIDLIELLADLEHTRWASWQEYLHSLCVRNGDGSLTIPTEKVNWWNHLIKTKYEDLTEKSKESDRKEARKTLEVLEKARQTILSETLEQDEKDNVDLTTAYMVGYEKAKTEYEDKIKELIEALDNDIKNNDIKTGYDNFNDGYYSGYISCSDKAKELVTKMFITSYKKEEV